MSRLFHLKNIHVRKRFLIDSTSVATANLMRSVLSGLQDYLPEESANTMNFVFVNRLYQIFFVLDHFFCLFLVEQPQAPEQHHRRGEQGHRSDFKKASQSNLKTFWKSLNLFVNIEVVFFLIPNRKLGSSFFLLKQIETPI